MAEKMTAQGLVVGLIIEETPATEKTEKTNKKSKGAHNNDKRRKNNNGACYDR
jgi:hypothetical protein